MYPVRNSVKAIIVENKRLLCIRKKGLYGFYYLLPGGGQEKDETVAETLKRECLEELGAHVQVGNLTYIREYIAKNHEFKKHDNIHQVEFMFRCRLITRPDEKLATNTDDHQNGIEWITLNDFKKYNIYPKVLGERIFNGYPEIYWGDIN